MENKLVKKLLLKPAGRMLLVNAPTGFEELLEPLPEGATLTAVTSGSCDIVLLFVQQSSELAMQMSPLHPHLRPETVLWVAYPKKSSGLETDLGMTLEWEVMVPYGLRPVTAISVNDAWTALRFRPNEQVKKSAVSNTEVVTNPFGAYIDPINRTVTAPDELQDRFEHFPAAEAFFKTLSYTNKKEYVLWILTAKQEKTRFDRLDRTVEKLLAGKKNPAEK
jgi:hypothetical protein